MRRTQSFLVIGCLVMVLLCLLATVNKYRRGTSLTHLPGQKWVSTRTKSDWRPSTLGPNHVAIEGELLAIPKDVADGFSPEVKKQLKNGQSVSREMVENNFLRNPKTRLLLRPRLLIGGEQEGTFEVVRDNKSSGDQLGGITLTVKPVIRPDSLVQMETDFSLVDGKSTASLSDHNRLVHPRPESYECFKRLKFGDQYIYVFLEVLTAASIKAASRPST